MRLSSVTVTSMSSVRLSLPFIFPTDVWFCRCVLGGCWTRVLGSTPVEQSQLLFSRQLLADLQNFLLQELQRPAVPCTLLRDLPRDGACKLAGPNSEAEAQGGSADASLGNCDHCPACNHRDRSCHVLGRSPGWYTDNEIQIPPHVEHRSSQGKGSEVQGFL